MNAKPAMVAIVDDDDAVRRALHRLVRSLSYQPVSFGSGDEFLESLREAKPACVIMDQHMPNLCGLDVLIRMRSDGISVPVVIITGQDQPGLRENCLQVGVAAFLIKPLEVSTVSDAIETAIGHNGPTT